MNVLVVDYGMGNLASVRRALEEVGAEVTVSGDPRDLGDAAGIVIPGVGSFADGMRSLRESGMGGAVVSAARDEGVPVLGICLGMQLLATRGAEGGGAEGLGLVPGAVTKMEPRPGERLPHVGWNEVHPEGDAAGGPLGGIAPGTDFYFVHSYHFVPDDPAAVAARTPYCGGFVSALATGPVWGAQFHPEKSSRAGFRLLENFLAVLAG